MRKREELTNPGSCMSRARDDEMTFVLLGRDAAAPTAIWAWIKERIRLGKNKPDDAQIVEATKWIETVLAESADARFVRAGHKPATPDQLACPHSFGVLVFRRWEQLTTSWTPASLIGHNRAHGKDQAEGQAT